MASPISFSAVSHGTSSGEQQTRVEEGEHLGGRLVKADRDRSPQIGKASHGSQNLQRRSRVQSWVMSKMVSRRGFAANRLLEKTSCTQEFRGGFFGG